MNILDIFKNWSDEDGLTVKGKAGISTLGNIANVGIQALGKGNTTTLGNVANTVGGLIPGPWGVAVQTAGSLVNAAFGSNINDNIVDSYMSDISSLANQQYNASDYKSLLAQQRNNNITIDKNSLGTQGWLSDKLDTTFNDLNVKLRDAEEQNRMAFNNQAAEINKSIFNTSLTNMRKRGGKLYIQPKRVFNNGGLMHQHGGIFSNGIIFIDNGGTHEQNPFEGVQIGVDAQGIPNMVEEGEVIWQDYVFSNRLKPTKEFKDKYKIKGETFADAANEMQKESEERVNDSISKRGLNDSMMKLMLEQEKVRSVSKRSTPNNMFDKGGKKTNKSKSDTLDTSSMVNSVLEHDYYVNQLGYRSVEEGKRIERESKTQKAIEDITGTSAPLTLEDVFSVFRKDKKYKTGRNKNNKFAWGGYPFEDEEPEVNYKGMSPDVVDAMNEEAAFIAGRQTGMSDEVIESLIEQKATGISEPLTIPVTKSGDSDSEVEGPKSRNSWLRYAPALGSAMGVFSDLLGITNKPDYSNTKLIQDATDRIKPISYNPIGTYLSYNPFDKNFYSSRLAEQAGATRRAITNQAINPGAAMAGLLAADYNAQTQLGGLFRQAEEYNQAQREKVAGFNRQTDAMNSEMAMKAAIANQSADELRLKSAITQAQMREQADATASAAKSANLTTMFDNLGAIGKENFIMDMLERNPALLYNWLGEYKGKACGGKINRRRRK